MAKGHGTKNIRPFLAITLLPFLVFGIFLFFLALDQAKQNHIATLWDHARQLEMKVQSFFLARKTELTLLGHIMTPGSAKLKRNTTAINQFVSKHGHYEALYLWNAKQKQPTALIQKQPKERTWLKSDSLSLDTIASFQQRISQLMANDFFVSDVIVHRPHRHLPNHFEPIIYVAVPLFRTSNHYIGALVGEIRAQRFLSLFGSFARMTDDALFLVNKNGSYMVHPELNRQWGTERRTGESVANDFPPSIVSQIVSGKPGSFKTIKGSLGISVPIYADSSNQNTFWSIVLTSESGSILTLLKRHQQGILGFVGVLAFVLTLLTYFYMRFVAAEKNLEKTRRDYIAMLTHDLKSPLSTIKLAVDVVALKASLPENLSSVLARASNSINRMTKMISNFLDLSKYESNKMSLDLATVDGEALISQIVESFSDKAQQKQISLKMIVDKDLPKMHVDSQKIERAITNLLDNAFKFTEPRGEITISARKTKSSGVLISVSDNGKGIPPHMISRIFDKYRQVKESEQIGTGLGLPIVKEIVEAHNGKVEVHSAVGKGTSFHIQFRRQKTSEEGL